MVNGFNLLPRFTFLFPAPEYIHKELKEDFSMEFTLLQQAFKIREDHREDV